MVYTFTQAPGGMQTFDELRKWTEEEFRRVAMASAELEPKVGLLAFTRVLSAAGGLVPYVGLGFKPKLVILTSCIAGGSNWGSFGQFTTASDNSALEIGTTTIAYQAGIAAIQRDNAGGTNFQFAIGSSMDVDGFTLNWGNVGAPTATASLRAICLR